MPNRDTPSEEPEFYYRYQIVLTGLISESNLEAKCEAVAKWMFSATTAEHVMIVDHAVLEVRDGPYVMHEERYDDPNCACGPHLANNRRTEGDPNEQP
jgi:hypothetical protein